MNFVSQHDIHRNTSICERYLNLLKRYTTDTAGKKHLLAKIYTKDEHCIDLESIDPLAVRICRRLKHEGYEAFIVGGAVRDLLQNIVPKDFEYLFLIVI